MAKIITNDIAEKNVGKYIDLYHRTCGYYPMQLIKVNDVCMLKDRNGVCMKIDDAGVNVHYYDYIFEMVREDTHGAGL